MRPETKSLLEDHKQEFQNYKKFLDKNNWQDDVYENAQTGKLESAKLKTEISIIKTIIAATNKFKEDIGEDIDKKPVQDFIKFTAGIINKHIDGIDSYKKQNPIIKNDSSDEEETDEVEVEFHSTLFALKTSTKVALTKLKIDENQTSKQSLDLFHSNTKAPLMMREFLYETFPQIKNKVDNLGIDFSKAHINPATSNEMFINMKPKDIPPWDPNKHFFEQEKSTIQFWEEERRKILYGVNIGGYHISPWLYWHLNHFNLSFGAGLNKKTLPPHFRDNEYFLDRMYNKAQDIGTVGLLLYGTRRYSKALKNDEKLYYFDGSIRNIGDSKVGDEIIGRNGKKTKITGVYPQGKVKLFKVTLADTREVVCCDDHLWTVFDRQSMRERVLPLKEFRKSYKYDRHYEGGKRINTCYNYYVPLNEQIELDNNVKPFIDPYFLGSWLGDGRSSGTGITTIDSETVAFLQKMADDNNMILNKRGDEYFITKQPTEFNNKILTLLKSKNLINNKHIPDECFAWSNEDKLSLIQGLMDTDGTVGKPGSPSFTNVNKYIFEGFVRLCRELGIGVYPYRDKIGGYVLQSGELNTYNRASVFTKKQIFRLTRKKERHDKVHSRNNVSRTFQTPIINIEEVGYDYATCIRVDNEDSTFLTTNCVVTHNSVSLASMISHKLFSMPKAQGTIQGYSEVPDLKAILDYIADAVEFMNPALKIPANNMDLKEGAVLGLKGKRAQDRFDFSRLSVVNLEGGNTKKGGQKTAGSTPDIFVFDEISKGDALTPWLAALPSFAGGENGKFRLTPLLAATAGDSELSKDAELMLKNPDTYKILPMDWDMLEEFVDPEYITWKRNTFGMFLPAQQSLMAPPKIITNLQEFLGSDNKELSKIKFHNTDWKAGKEYFEKERKQLSGDITMLASYTNSFPLDPEDCYLTTEKNIFPGLECKNRKAEIEREGLTGQAYELWKDSSGNFRADFSNKPNITDYPYKGNSIDAPVVMLENPLLQDSKPPLGLYCIGFDDAKHDQTDGDSVLSATVVKRSFEGGEWANRIVAWYDSRPERKKDYYKVLYMLMKIFNARLLHENDDNGFIEYLEDKHPDDLFIHVSEGIGLASEENLIRNKNRKWGVPANPTNIYNWTQRVVRYTKDENITIGDQEGLSGVDIINHPMLLEELYKYKKKNNADRLRSFSLALTLAQYYDKTYQFLKTRKKEVRDDDKVQKKIKKTSRGLVDTSKLK